MNFNAVILYSHAYDAVDVKDNDNFVTALSAQIQINIVLKGTVRKLSIELIVLAKLWGITPEKAQKTKQNITQRGIRTILYPLMLRQSRTNDRNFHYHHLAHPVFSDTIFSSIVFRRGNQYAQVYATDFGWVRAFSMASRSEAFETLSLLFASDDIP